jgi:hypothetical protein
LSEEIPQKEDYRFPFLSGDLKCYYCGRFERDVREICNRGREKFSQKFWWLCPNCFNKLILKRTIKEKVEFT